MIAALLAVALVQAPALDDLVVVGTAADVNAAIARGADVNAKDGDGITALMRAASAGRGEIVAALLAAGADARATTSGGVNALMMASLGGYTDAARALLAAKVDANLKDNQGRTALMAAASGSEQAIVDALLAAGADVRLVDAGGASALTYAAAEGFEGAVVAFQKRGAKPTDRELMLAAARCHTGIVRSFLAGGMTVNPKEAGTTPLIVAAGGNCTDTVTLLVERGADVNAKDGDGMTPLIKAASAGHPDLVRLLLAKGADMNVTDSSGRSAWTYAALSRREDVAEIFRAARAAATPIADITVTSTALKPNGPMPRESTADGGSSAPPLSWTTTPERTVSFVVIGEDADAGDPPPVFWMVYNIPGSETGLAGNIRAATTATPYRAPAAPSGQPHRYHFIVCALDVGDLPPNLNRAQLTEAMKGHIVGKGELVATSGAKP